ncbi:IclR family transcriptional regulator [Stappia indica]|uniref:IclR family transcriptional regulator n=1 Tax=Stappia indica TaxID=538381 RepID=UPI001CD44D61|nr:IclR family transcriptional regulator [Stappia indica]MCA1298448.1 IclR family transcriptional regulator [Stappia indica]
MTAESPSQKGGTVGKAMEVLDCVARFGTPVRFSQILEVSRFPKPTLYRLVRTLADLGMLDHDADKDTYMPGRRLLKLAHVAWAQFSLASIARPHIDRLGQQVSETIHLAQLDQGQVLYLDKRNARDPVEMYSQAGKVGPTYCTGVGKAMLAFLTPEEQERVIALQSFHRFTPHTLVTPEALRARLETIRTQGYALDEEEHETGIICIAMPVLNGSGRVLGSVSITDTVLRTTWAALKEKLPLLRETVERIGHDAQDWHYPGI